MSRGRRKIVGGAAGRCEGRGGLDTGESVGVGLPPWEAFVTGKCVVEGPGCGRGARRGG